MGLAAISLGVYFWVLTKRLLNVNKKKSIKIQSGNHNYRLSPDADAEDIKKILKAFKHREEKAAV